MPADAINALIASIPNLAVALWVLWRDDKRITALLESQRWLIEQLMALSPPQPPTDAGDGKEETH